MSHLRALTSLEVRVFLNLGFVTGTCSLAQTSWYFCPEQRACPPNETNYPEGLCSSQSYGTTKPKSHSMDPYSCACSRAHFRRTFKVKISRCSTLPMTCFFPTSCMFPCHQLTCLTHRGCLSSSITQEKLQLQSQRLRFKPLLHLFFF